MQKKVLFIYFSILAALLLIMSLSRSTTEQMRGKTIAWIAPYWDQLAKVSFFFSRTSTEALLKDKNDEIARLELENRLLINELSHLQSLFNYQQEIQLQESVAAHVLMRSFDTWNNFLWINVGSADNQNLFRPDIALNSPVVVGEAVVGLIDLVEKHQSRVRLITDPRLNPSVRAARGGLQERHVDEQIDLILNWIRRKKVQLLSPKDKLKLSELLTQLKGSLQPTKKSYHLAKGELQGSTQPTGRSHKPLLKGTGFNYDFSDDKGEARDLRTGKPVSGSEEELSLLKVNDILVTTGMDGVFPEGLKVATVTKIELLKEGDFYYELEAKPIVNNFQELDLVFVIAPISQI